MHMEVELNLTVRGVLPPLELPLQIHHISHYITARLCSTACQQQDNGKTRFLPVSVAVFVGIVIS